MLPPDLEKIEAKVKQGLIWFYWIVCFRLKNILFFTKMKTVELFYELLMLGIFLVD